MEHIREDELISSLRTLAGRLLRTPRASDMETYSPYSVWTYQDRFGSWSDALQVAGLLSLPEPSIDDATALDALSEYGTDCKGIPPRRFVAENGEYHPFFYTDRFETWLDALSLAGFDVSGRVDGSTKATDEELVAALRQIDDEFERPVTKQRMDRHGGYRSQIYEAQFGSWENALAVAEVQSPHDGTKTFTDEQLLDEIRALATTNETTPTARMMDGEGRHASVTYMHRFGSWNNAIEAAGLEPNRTRRSIDEDVLLSDLTRLAAKLGKTPTKAEMMEHGEYYPKSFVTYFGSWNAAVRAAGLEPNTPGR